MNWTGPQKRKLRAALLQIHGWRGLKSLERFASDNFERSLYDVSGDNPEDWAAALIDKAQAEGWIEELYQTLCKSNLSHEAVRNLQSELGRALQAEKEDGLQAVENKEILRKESLGSTEQLPPERSSLSFTSTTFNGPVNFASNYGNQAQHQTIRDEKESTEAVSLSSQLLEAYDDRELEAFLPEPSSIDTDVGQFSRTAKAVCKVTFTDRATTGTGVLLESDLVLTNYHILSRIPLEDTQLVETARSLLFEFGRLSESSNSPIKSEEFSTDSTNPIIAASPPNQLDYVLLKLSSAPSEVRYQPAAIASSTQLQKKDSLSLLHHPAGAVMRASLSASGVVEVSEKQGKVWYVNRTKGGSSGAPCFNKDWQMVALHHAAMARGFGSIREGILMSAILAEIEAFLPK